MESQSEKAGRFRLMPQGPGVLILPNAWDVASARIFEDAGFPAMATTSAGIAFMEESVPYIEVNQLFGG